MKYSLHASVQNEQASASRIITVKYEFPVFLTNHVEDEFGTMFQALEDDPVADFMSFFFLADEIDEQQRWKTNRMNRDEERLGLAH